MTLRSLTMALGMGILALTSFHPAQAQLTPAGTAITNQAILNYRDANGNPLPEVRSNIVTTIVSQVASVDISPENNYGVGGNLQTVNHALQVFNTGNGTDTFNLTISGVDPGWTVVLYADANGNGILDPAELAAGPITNTGSLAQGGVFHLIASVATPNVATAPDGSSETFQVTATSQFNASVSDTSNVTTTISSAVIRLTKAATPNTPNPGDVITYTINYNNTGTASGTAAVVTDPLPANVTFVPGSIALNSVNLSDANDADAGDFGGTAPNRVTVRLGTVNAGASGSITFQVRVNENIPAGSNITNVAELEFQAGGQTITETSNPATTTVGQTAAIDLANVDPVSSTANPGDTFNYQFTVTNNGNGNDVIDLTVASTLSRDLQIWVDNNNDGIAGNNGDYLLTDTDGDGIIDTGSLPQGATLNLILVGSIAPGTSPAAVDTVTITGRSSVDPTQVDSIQFVTTVTAPNVSIAKAVAPQGPQPPGTVLTYTVVLTNNGNGFATQVFMTDPIPANTDYVPGSIRLDGVPQTDAVDADVAEFTNNTVVVGLASMGANAIRTVTFQVVIR